MFSNGSCVAYRSNGIPIIRLPLPIQHPLRVVGGPHSSPHVPWERRAGVSSQGPWGSIALSDAVYVMVRDRCPVRPHKNSVYLNDVRACVGSPCLAR